MWQQRRQAALALEAGSWRRELHAAAHARLLCASASASGAAAAEAAVRVGVSEPQRQRQRPAAFTLPLPGPAGGRRRLHRGPDGAGPAFVLEYGRFFQLPEVVRQAAVTVAYDGRLTLLADGDGKPIAVHHLEAPSEQCPSQVVRVWVGFGAAV
jgi:hypothetical protein